MTPNRYLELLDSVGTMVREHAESKKAAVLRFERGLDQLESVEDLVASLKADLDVKLPQLKQTEIEVAELMETLIKNKAAAQDTKAAVEKDEAQAEIDSRVAQEAVEVANNELSIALPVLEKARTALSGLTKQNIFEIRSLLNPPQGMTIAIEAVCILFMRRPRMVDAPSGRGKKIADYWPEARALMNDNFVKKLLEYDTENIPPEAIAKLGPYIDNEKFTEERMGKISEACRALCAWVHAMYNFYFVNERVKPLQASAEEARVSLENTLLSLDEARRALRAVEEKISALENQHRMAETRKEQLAADVALCRVRIERATQLSEGLGGEKISWASKVAELKASFGTLLGDSILAAAFVTYLSPFGAAERADLVSQFKSLLVASGIPFQADWSMRSVLGNDAEILNWNLQGLPRDPLSVDNALVVIETKRWPLLLDPQEQANKWIKRMEKDSDLCVVRLSQEGFQTEVENCVKFGKPLLIEQVGDTLPPALDPILRKEVVRVDGVDQVLIGERFVPISPDFRLYITSNHPRPEFPPSIATQLTLINFEITFGGLTDQLLAIVVEKEAPVLEERKNKLIIETAANTKTLRETEDKILVLLAEATGDILDDEVLIATLNSSKEVQTSISAALKTAERTRREIEAARQRYVPIGERGTILFFAVCDLAAVDPMYQFSLVWFLHLFGTAIESTDVGECVGS